MINRATSVCVVLLLVTAACAGVVERSGETGDAPLSAGQETFWNRLAALCGQAFEGRVILAPDGDSWYDAERIVMHVRECGDRVIRIPLHIDANRSRTWVVSRTGSGLRLKHDHRLESGMPDSTNTQYGGDTVGPGSPWRQEFPADAYSIGVVPARASQLWFLEIRPGDAFVYGLRREATGMRYLVEFDLTRPVAPPPPPWAHHERQTHVMGSVGARGTAVVLIPDR
jgi:hypothetical protein